MQLRGKVIVITGASSGFGELIARRCAAAGANVVLAARSAGKLEQLASELGSQQALVVPTDVGDDRAVAALAEATLARFGHADVLLNNAGFGIFDRLHEARLDDLRQMVEVNLYGAVRCTQAFLPQMLARRHGQVVMMASLAGLLAAANLGFYNVTKAGLVALGRTLMVELAGTGVRCAVICPGVAETGFQQISGDSKYPRITRLSACTAEQVATATLRAMLRRTHGEVLVPGYVAPLIAVAGAFPGLARLVMRVVG